MNVRDLGIFFKGVWTCLKREMENAGAIKQLMCQEYFVQKLAGLSVFGKLCCHSFKSPTT